MNRPTIVVVAAVLIEGPSVLLTQRKTGTHLAGAWEFPGGKVEPDEDPRDALSRELREELGISTEIGPIFEVTFHRYETKSVLLLFYEVSRARGSAEPRAIDVADWRWATRSELRDELFPPADLSVLAKLRERMS